MAKNLLETGDTSQAVTAQGDGSLYAGLASIGCCVLSSGNKMAAEVQSNNIIRIADGSALMYGRHVRIGVGDDQTVTINNGELGFNRKDLIVLRYKRETSGKESVVLEVIQGTNTSGTPSAPDYNKGDVLLGDTEVDFPLYSVVLEGANIVNVTAEYTRVLTTEELLKRLQTAEENIKALIEADDWKNAGSAKGNAVSNAITIKPTDKVREIYVLVGVAGGVYIGIQLPTIAMSTGKYLRFANQWNSNNDGLISIMARKTSDGAVQVYLASAYTEKTDISTTAIWYLYWR